LLLLKNVGGKEYLRSVSTPDGAAVMARILAAMICVENGIKWNEVDREALLEGYEMAFPDSERPKVIW